MKKCFLAAIMLLLATFAFCQKDDERQSETQILSYQANEYTKLDGVMLEIVYFPYIDQARVRYIVLKSEYSEDDAVVVIRNMLLDFLKLKGYYHYYRILPDKVKYTFAYIDGFRRPIVKYEALVKLTN